MFLTKMVSSGNFIRFRVLHYRKSRVMRPEIGGFERTEINELDRVSWTGQNPRNQSCRRRHRLDSQANLLLHSLLTISYLFNIY